FYLIAEITGGRNLAFDTLRITGLDAALGIDEIPDKLEFLVKGLRNPNDYFSLFRNSELVGQGSHTWFRNTVVTLFNDHDQVSKGRDKARFCADAAKAKGVLSALALNVMTLGIPCIYYGTEQSFDGHGSGPGADKFIREAMFGGEFGSFASRNRHFFNEDSQVYRELRKILQLREGDRIYTRGRQFLRPISGDATGCLSAGYSSAGAAVLVDKGSYPAPPRSPRSWRRASIRLGSIPVAPSAVCADHPRNEGGRDDYSDRYFTPTCAGNG